MAFEPYYTFIQKTKKSYTDTRTRRNLANINTELQDVQKIMVQNIDDVMKRGVGLEELDNKASNLSTISKKYRQDAKALNLRSRNAKIAAILVIIFLVSLALYFWW
nr:vesicle-trafficking protein SEC22b-like [Lytechinus pictus]